MEIKIYTDGASRGNPGPAGWGAVLFLDNQVVELGGRIDLGTNNQMELSAPTEALKYLEEANIKEAIKIVTDSQYVLSGITSWVHGWKNNGWIKKDGGEVSNREYWEELDRLQILMNPAWEKVKGHDGDIYNERADQIATGFATKKDLNTFSGTNTDYEIFVKDKVDLEAIKKSAKSSSSNRNRPGGYYISLVDGEFQKHVTWPECEARVKGVKWCKFKKVFNEEEEGEVKKGWGI